MNLEDKKKGSQYIDKDTTEVLYFGSEVREAVLDLRDQVFYTFHKPGPCSCCKKEYITLTKESQGQLCMECVIDKIFGFKKEKKK